ncbi:MAG: hypothetical protein ACWGOX_14750 [Desulforhopalus sp.]
MKRAIIFYGDKSFYVVTPGADKSQGKKDFDLTFNLLCGLIYRSKEFFFDLVLGGRQERCSMEQGSMLCSHFTDDPDYTACQVVRRTAFRSGLCPLFFMSACRLPGQGIQCSHESVLGAVGVGDE